MHIRSKTLLGTAIASLMATSAMAQQSPDAPENYSSSIPYDEYLESSDLRASKLLGATVRNEQGEELGDINELIISRKDDVITAVIGVGGFLGIGEKSVGVSYDELRVTDDGTTVYFPATRAELESQPDFYSDGSRSGQGAASSDRYGEVARQAANDSRRDSRTTSGRQASIDEAAPSNSQQQEAAYARQAARESASDRRQASAAESTLSRNERPEPGSVEIDDVPDAPSASANERSASAADVETMGRSAHRASALIGLPVVDSSGEEIGEIDDLVVSENDKLMAVLSVGGFLGIGDRLIALPVDDLYIEQDEDADAEPSRVKINRTAEQLMNAEPEFRYELSARLRNPSGQSGDGLNPRE